MPEIHLGDLDVFDTQRTYGVGARNYQAASMRSWPGVTRRAVELMDVRPGNRVLEVGCGPGELLAEAAGAVGAGGRVTGVDKVPEMLELAARRVADAGVGDRVTLEVGDMHDLGRYRNYDRTACVFAYYFAREFVPVARELLVTVGRRGRLVIATIGVYFEPGWGKFVEQVARVRPDLDLAMPWDREEVRDGEQLARVLRSAGAQRVELVREDLAVPLARPGEWWETVMEGTGAWRAAEELGGAAAGVRAGVEAWIAAEGLTSVTLSVNYASVDV